MTNLELGLATLFIGSVGNVGYTLYSNWDRERKLRSALSAGAVPEIKTKVSLVERVGPTEAIKSILKPKTDYAQYNMIVGNHATGKTTLVRLVGHQLDGILYVNINPTSVSHYAFAQEMSKALHWTPASRFWLDKIMSFWGITTRTAKAADDGTAFFDQIFNEFTRQAEQFKKQNGRTPVLVLDNVDRIAQNNPKLLDVLQDLAKDAADDRLFITVFVTSEGTAPIQMLGRSASSRLGKVLEIGDLTNSEAMHYLCNKRGVDRSLAQEVYNLVGGRVGLLLTTIDELNSGEDLNGVQALRLRDAKKILRKVKMDSDIHFERIGIDIAKKILENGRISLDDFYNMSGNSGDKLLSINVFTNVPRTEWVCFDTKPMELAVGALVKDRGC